jgi:hypothetical protein
MKIIRTLTITSDEFYDFLETSVLAQANASPASRKFHRGDIRTGLRFAQGPAGARTTFVITDYVRGLRYCAQSCGVADTIFVSYHTNAKEEGLEVTYEQTIEGYEEASSKKNRFLRGFSDAVYLSRMSNSLYDIQNKILNHRQGADPKKTPSLPQRREPILYQIYKKSVEKKEKKAAEAARTNDSPPR